MPRQVVAIHPCDSNKNGDISFSECWNCINNAIKANTASMLICYFSNGWDPKITSCGVSVAAACVYISATIVLLPDLWTIFNPC